jgi:GGDEF domain-containing protein
MAESVGMAMPSLTDRTAWLRAALEVEIGLTEREGEPLTLVIASVDGPSAAGLGEDPLTRVLQVLAGVLREGDLSLRRSKREFAVLLPGADRFASAMVCQRMDGVVRAALREMGADVSLTFGLAERADGSTPQDMIAAAEAELAGARSAAA